MIWMEKILAEHADTPAPFLPFAALRAADPDVETLRFD